MGYLAAIFAYLLLLVGIGAYKSRQVKTEEDFAVAGRSLSPWIMVCTMLAVWIGTGSIVGNAEETYNTGLAALIIPLGTFFGMLLLSFIATRVRDIEASSVPEIIGRRYGATARLLTVVALITAYMVIVSYQFNAGGAVLEVITGNKDAVTINSNTAMTRDHVTKGRMVYTPIKDWTGTVQMELVSADNPSQTVPYTIKVVNDDEIIATIKAIKDAKEKLKDAAKSIDDPKEKIKNDNEAQRLANTVAIKKDNYTKIRYELDSKASSYSLKTFPSIGTLDLVEPKLTAKKATIIAAVFIIAYTMLAGLLSLAYTDIVTGILITVTSVVALPVLLYNAGGISGMSESFAAMQDKTTHMEFWSYSPVMLVNIMLPVFLLILGDANQYQRIFASRNAKGAKKAVLMMVFIALAIELLIISNAFVASSMTPDPENGKYILIYAAKNLMPGALGVIFLVTVVGIIVSTANSFLLIPSITFIKDVYQAHINPKATDKQTIFLNRALILIFGVIGYGVSLIFSESTGFFEKALYAYTIYGSSVTPCLVAALIWKRATKQGAITSILSGTVITLLWGELIQPEMQGWLGELDAVLPAIAVSVTALIGVSLLTQPKKVP